MAEYDVFCASCILVNSDGSCAAGRAPYFRRRSAETKYCSEKVAIPTLSTTQEVQTEASINEPRFLTETS